MTQLPEGIAYDLLSSYDPNKDQYCVVKKDGEEILSKIDRDQANSILNIIGKLFGWGPLANKDTSTKGVEEYLVKLFLSDTKDNPLKTMASDSNAYKTTKKIAALADKEGIHALKNVLIMKKIYDTKLTPEQKETTSLEDLMLAVGIGGHFQIEDLRNFVELLKSHKKVVGEIREQSDTLKGLSQDKDLELKKQLFSQSISDLKRHQNMIERKIFIARYGSEAAKKLPVEDLRVLFRNRRLEDLADNKKTEADLKAIVTELKQKEPITQTQTFDKEASDKKFEEGLSKQEEYDPGVDFDLNQLERPIEELHKKEWEELFGKVSDEVNQINPQLKAILEQVEKDSKKETWDDF